MKKILFLCILCCQISCAAETPSPEVENTAEVKQGREEVSSFISECGEVIYDIGTFIYGVIYIIATPVVAAVEAVD